MSRIDPVWATVAELSHAFAALAELNTLLTAGCDIAGMRIIDLYAESRQITTNPLSGISRAYTDGGEVWRSSDGSTWNRVVATGFGDDHNAAVSALVRFNGQLYAGTRSFESEQIGGYSPDLWRSSSGDGLPST
jgi:phospholipase/lecithinase/hemolysin